MQFTTAFDHDIWYTKKTDYGVEYYDKTHLLHNKYRPAREDDNGTEFWYIHGERHRSDGPAVYVVGNKWRGEYYEWWYHGKRHRVDGPAVIHVCEYELWYIDGVAFKDGGKEYQEARHRYVEEHGMDGMGRLTKRADVKNTGHN